MDDQIALQAGALQCLSPKEAAVSVRGLQEAAERSQNTVGQVSLKCWWYVGA